MGFGYSQHMVEQIFKNANCELLDTYQNTRTPMKYKCSCGNITTIRLDSFQAGYRCIECGRKNMANKNANTHDYVAAYFKKFNCELLDTYTRGHVKMKYRCSCGNTSKITFVSFQQGHRCSLCGNDKAGRSRTGPKHPAWNPDREQIALNHTMAKRMADLLAHCLRRLNTLKEGHMNDLLGYSAQELWSHLSCFPEFEYLQQATWHIDHIFPVKAFITYGITDLKIINALDNLRPLSAEINCAKSDWYDKEQFFAYCARHGFNITQEEEQVI